MIYYSVQPSVCVWSEDSESYLINERAAAEARSGTSSHLWNNIGNNQRWAVSDEMSMLSPPGKP